MAPSRRCRIGLVASVVGLLVVLAQLTLIQQQVEAAPSGGGGNLDFVAKKGETRADKRGANTPTLKRELDPDDEMDVTELDLDDDDASESGKSRAGETLFAVVGEEPEEITTKTTTTHEREVETSEKEVNDTELELEEEDNVVDPLSHGKSRLADVPKIAGGKSSSSSTSPAPSSDDGERSTPAAVKQDEPAVKAEGGSRAEGVDVQETKENDEPVIVLKIHPVEDKSKTDDDDDDDGGAKPSVKPTLSPTVKKLVKDNKGRTDSHGLVTITIKPSALNNIKKLNQTGEIVQAKKKSKQDFEPPNPITIRGTKTSTTTKKPLHSLPSLKPTTPAPKSKTSTASATTKKSGKTTKKPDSKGKSTKKPDAKLKTTRRMGIVSIKKTGASNKLKPISTTSKRPATTRRPATTKRQYTVSPISLRYTTASPVHPSKKSSPTKKATKKPSASSTALPDFMHIQKLDDHLTELYKRGGVFDSYYKDCLDNANPEKLKQCTNPTKICTYFPSMCGFEGRALAGTIKPVYKKFKDCLDNANPEQIKQCLNPTKMCIFFPSMCGFEAKKLTGPSMPAYKSFKDCLDNANPEEIKHCLNPSKVCTYFPSMCGFDWKKLAGTLKPAYQELKDSDKMLAVVVTKRGGFKGRRLNAKAIATIMAGQMGGNGGAGKPLAMDANKPITVTTNNTFVFPAGTYYFPKPVRVAGFVSP